MGRKEKKRIDLGGAEGGLTHNPFAALGGLKGDTSPSPTEEVAKATPTEAAGPSAAGGRVEVRFEKKGRGGKAVTVARWLDEAPGPGDLATIAKTAAKSLGAGAKVEGDAVVLQGRQVDRLAAHLESSLGVRVSKGAS